MGRPRVVGALRSTTSRSSAAPRRTSPRSPTRSPKVSCCRPSTPVHTRGHAPDADTGAPTGQVAADGDGADGGVRARRSGPRPASATRRRRATPRRGHRPRSRNRSRPLDGRPARSSRDRQRADHVARRRQGVPRIAWGRVGRAVPAQDATGNLHVSWLAARRASCHPQGPADGSADAAYPTRSDRSTRSPQRDLRRRMVAYRRTSGGGESRWRSAFILSPTGQRGGITLQDRYPGSFAGCRPSRRSRHIAHRMPPTEHGPQVRRVLRVAGSVDFNGLTLIPMPASRS